MIFLFTDFSPAGPYVGQMEAVIKRTHRNVNVINLVSDAPTGEPRIASYLSGIKIPLA